MERRSFSREFKVEAVRLVRERGVWVALAAARADVFDDIERFYNRRWRHSTLGYLSPVAFEERQRSA